MAIHSAGLIKSLLAPVFGEFLLRLLDSKLLSCATCLAWLLCSPSIPAHSQQTVIAAALPSNSELDAMLAARDWKGLGAALSRPRDGQTYVRALDWLHRRIDEGGGMLLSFFFARDLWLVGDSRKIDDPGKDPRISAGVMTLYAYELIQIDGAKCEDRSAPANRLNQLFGHHAAVLAFLKKQSVETKIKVATIAIGLEKKTAQLRKDDDFICRDGLDQMRAGLERGTQHQIPSPNGQVGKTIGVEPPADWIPKFVSPAIYQPMQDKARNGMREQLLKLID